LLLLGLFGFQIFLSLPPGIPFVSNAGLFPFRLRLSNFALAGAVAFGLYAFGFTPMESVTLGLLWMPLAVYLVFDIMTGVPLAV